MAQQAKHSSETSTRDGKLVTGPLMVYPSNPEDRQAIVDAVNEMKQSNRGESISNWMMQAAKERLAREARSAKKVA